MEKPERLESDDPTLRDPKAQEYLQSLERTNPDLIKKAEELGEEAVEGFWSKEQLAARFGRDENEYNNVLDWLSSIHEMIRAGVGSSSIKKREATFLTDLEDARNSWIQGKDPEELSRLRAFAVRTLWKDLLEEDTNPELFSESAYEQWKQPRVPRFEK
ncbi:MAG: hypothetical protein Q7R73_00710 [bacterium]|nr:hypothetical protein [bacterium]